jgi:hypothetical protein
MATVRVRSPLELKIFPTFFHSRVKVDRISVFDLKVAQISVIHLLAEISANHSLNIKNLFYKSNDVVNW